MLLSYFDYIFVHLRQKLRLRPELSPKFLSTLGPNPARTQTRPEKPGPTYNSVSIWRSGSSRDFRISRDVHFVNYVTALIFWRNLISDACTCDRTLSVITKFSWPNGNAGGEKGLRMFQKLRTLLLFDNSHLTTTE